jgi:hypothetical protein
MIMPCSSKCHVTITIWCTVLLIIAVFAILFQELTYNFVFD